ncbi:MAG: 1-deoxy-D-xylulose-5-phosphate synthase [Selenomonadaceae bacterium]|nr:1-deoxy-D-xylulose-5-phosphate synthase [Selenomonadaceae bacterium]
MERLLDKITSPKIVHDLNLQELRILASEIRELILSTVANNGGHLAPSLGTVELTLALYSVFDFDNDKLVWDVGHQAYTHKILTGRKDTFHTLRTKGGLTGFPKRSESKYDAFGVGHSSTSISAALGILIASELEHKNNHVIAVIGDGALTGGEAFEALNHAGQLKKNLIVILNDNEMSIDKNVGALSEYLSQIRLAPQYRRAKKDFEDFVRKIPIANIGDKILSTANSIRYGLKSAIVPSAIFESLGFTYLGPVDGHDIKAMQDILIGVKDFEVPVLIHVHTTKGKGYKPAEDSPEKFHGVGKFDKFTGEIIKKPAPPSYTSVFSRAIIDCAKSNNKIVAVTAAMPSGTGLKLFSEIFPQRFFDVGIAEEHAITLSAGMAAGGLHPVVAIYSTFAQRAYDQILHDVCLQNLPLTLCLDRAGLVGEDGATHHGVFDLSYLRNIPNMNILAPKDENELRQMFFAAVNKDFPVAIRYPRGSGLGVKIIDNPQPLPWGKAEVISKVSGEADVSIFAVGTMVEVAKNAADLLKVSRIYANVVNCRFIKPLDKNIISELAKSSKLLVTCEENVMAGGFGSAVTELLADNNIVKPIMRFGIGDNFVEHGPRAELLTLCGLTAENMVDKIRNWIFNIHN